LFWPGKKRALRAAQEPTTATLKPMKTDSKDWDTTKNILIEGDNLEVLKILQKRYHNQIKMIYIDPPYNTGKDFIYPDNYKEGLQSYLEFTRQVDEGGKKLSSNSETAGRYHSNWLNMMYPRLKLARNLLSDDGVMFISIDDNEQENLKRLCTEIFGEDNFVAELPTIMNLKGNNDQFGFAGTHEYTIVFAKNINLLHLGQFLVDEEGLEDWEEDETGPYKKGANLKATGGNAPRNKRPNLYFPLYVSKKLEISDTPKPGWSEVLPLTDGEEMSWRWSKDKFNRESSDVIVVPSGDSFTFYKKQRPGLGDIPSSKPKSIFYKPEYSSGNGTAVVKKLFDGRKVFDNPKPLKLIEDFIQIGANDSESIVLDLFAGSGTVSHAIMSLNAQDGGARKWIAIQLPEPTEEESEAFRAGYKNIAEVTRARIRFAGEAILNNQGLFSNEKQLDTGFRYYRLADTNFTKWKLSSDTTADALEQRLLELRDSSDDAATSEDLLIEILLKQGFSLTEQVERVSIAGLNVYSVGDKVLLAYLDEHVTPTLDQLRTILDLGPVKFIILEDAFQGDDELKTNLKQICKTKQIELWTA
jgi:adenine-specific DNA-methyltransferase